LGAIYGAGERSLGRGITAVATDRPAPLPLGAGRATRMRSTLILGRGRAMHWKDFELPGGGPFQGLDVTVAPDDLPAGAPWLRVEAAPGRIRVTCAGQPMLWARIHRYHYGLWRLLAGAQASWGVVPPIRSTDLSAVREAPHTGAWWATWARWFARALTASPRTPLYPARWALTAARAADAPSPPIPAAPPAHWSGLARVDRVRGCLDEPALAWESWFTNGSGALLRTREPGPVDGARVRAFRKRARDRTLPPVLAQYVSGLDMFALLDGHDRLRAALLEGSAPPLLVLWQARTTAREPDPGRQAAVAREIERKRRLAGPRERPLTISAENALLVSAFDDRDWMFATTRAFPIAGGAARWDEEVTARAGVTADHPLFSGKSPPR
jgi:hypothetical protein